MKIGYALVCWFIWNFAIFNLDKNKDDESHVKFGYRQYASEVWENWVGSLFTCIFLLLVMNLGFGVDVLSTIGVTTIKWSDALIGASGPAYEAVMWGIKKVKSYFAAKQ